MGILSKAGKKDKWLDNDRSSVGPARGLRLFFC
jgi:hypothetical protein